jgi:hypothetical protein
MLRSYFATLPLHYFIKVSCIAGPYCWQEGCGAPPPPPPSGARYGGMYVSSHWPLCKFPEGVLAGMNLAQEFGWIESAVQLTQALLGLVGHLGRIQNSLVRSLGPIMVFRDLGPVALLLDEHHDWLEEVEVEPQGHVEGMEGGTGGRALIAVIADHLPHGGPVLLLDVGLVVFLVGSTTRGGDALLLAVALEVVVDELRAVVGVQA